MADCFYHPGRDAVGACVTCGKMICVECRTTLGDKIYCQPCADELFVKGPAKAPKPTAQGVSGAWWLMPIFLVWVGGLIAWAVTKDRDAGRARAMLYWGIGLTFLYPLCWLLVTVLVALLGAGAAVGLTWP